MALKLITAGESHGPGLTCIVEGLPAGPRARPRGDRPRHGPPPARPRPRRADEDRARQRGGHRRRPPRPHARRPDRAAGRQPRLRQLGGADEPVAGRGRGAPRSTCRAPATPTSSAPGSTASTDVRNVLERASARETAARVAGGALAKAFLRALGVEVRSHVVQIGSVARAGARRAADASRTSTASTTTPCAAWTPRRAARWSSTSTSSARPTSRSAASSRSSPSALVPGLGSHVSWEERLDGRLAGALCSIQAVKGVAIGDGFDVAGRPGSRGPRRDLLQRRARLLPRDQPRRRPRGRHDDGRAARRARRR